MLDYATDRQPTVLLTNAMLLRGHRLDRIAHLAGNPRLVIQTWPGSASRATTSPFAEQHAGHRQPALAAPLSRGAHRRAQAQPVSGMRSTAPRRTCSAWKTASSSSAATCWSNSA